MYLMASYSKISMKSFYCDSVSIR